MPQTFLPMVPPGVTPINGSVSVMREDYRWTYFVGPHPVYMHPADSRREFLLVCTQLIESGACRQIDIINTFGVHKRSLIRAQKKYREGGIESFFTRRAGRKGGSVLTPPILAHAQQLLDQGFSRPEVATELGVPYDTLRKAVNDGRLHMPAESEKAGTDKSTRSVADASVAEGMGTACTRVGDRGLAALGMLDGAPTCFENCRDVPYGGILCAIPALIGNGLLNAAGKLLGDIHGYYSAMHVLILLSFMALCRIKTVEQLRGQAPGEFGKLLGLDRIPEVRCLRKKMDDLSAGNAAERWSAHLCKGWMEKEPEAAGTLYVDGHVRVYHGSQTKLPRKYVSRERLCLRGTTDYWVNDAIGRPFFVVEKTVDPGMLSVLRKEIVPRLLLDVPGQPSEQEFEDDPYLSRFILVFDREGYSPEFFGEMWREHRIACITYHKHPGDDWPVEEFTRQQVSMPRGEVVTMKLAERGSLVGSGKAQAMWMREVRKLSEGGHQSSLISTGFDLNHTELAARLFSRWCQENFFRYMMQHFAIDLLLEYGTEELSGTQRVVNPAWRQMDKQKRSVQGQLTHRRAKFAALTMHPEDENNPKRYENWKNNKAELLEQIEDREKCETDLKAALKQTPKHITWDELPKEEQFHRLTPSRKRFMDTVRMIAYRAETAMIDPLLCDTVDSAAARRILQDLFTTEADILPEKNEQRLRVRVHRSARPVVDRHLARLFERLNQTEQCYPGTKLRMVYELAGLPAENGASESSQK